MKLIFCAFLVLTLVTFDECASDVRSIKSQILEHVNEIKNLIEELDNDESSKQEEIRTTGVWVPWNSSNKSLPLGFVIGGTDDSGWYGVVIRANYSNNLIPGKYNPDAHTAFVSYDGREIGIDDDFEILTHNSYVWTRKVRVKSTDSLIEGGYENDRKTFICKAMHNDEWVCGKLYDGVCKVPFGGKEYTYDDYIALQSRD